MGDSDSIRDVRKQPFAWFDKALIIRDGEELGAQAIAVYCVLSAYANNDTGQAFPSVNTIAKQCGITPPTAHKALATLSRMGWIAIEARKAASGGHLSNQYTLLDCPSPQLDLYPPINDVCPPPKPGLVPPTQPGLHEQQEAITKITKQESQKPLTDWQQRIKTYAAALCALTGDDINISKIASRAGKIAAMHLKAGYGVSDIANFNQYWYANDWRGKKGQPPTLTQVETEIGKIRSSAAQSPLPPPPELDEGLKRRAQAFGRKETQCPAGHEG